ncbi:MAG TPA: type I DNA topoisomerase [Gemmatimonadaceae bacterium]|nr:type I DNA topoisomerase [Gemmatimonadaceae bacterium]
MAAKKKKKSSRPRTSRGSTIDKKPARRSLRAGDVVAPEPVKRRSTKRSARSGASAKRGVAAVARGARRSAAPPENVGDGGAPTGTTSLVIVESPAKARTIGKYLGRGYRVRATVGHLRDLPTKKLGIDVDNGFQPEYVTIPGKEKTLADLKSAAKDSREIFLATDPDREGEAIAWHVAEQIGRRGGAPIRRVLFHEITRDAIRRAIADAGTIDEKKVEAQQARRVLDRLVGYKASPLLWKTVKKGLSAGRVQTVALRLIVEREREIRAFNPVEYWSIAAEMEKGRQRFTAKLHAVDGRKPEIPNEAVATRILNDVREIARRTPTKKSARSPADVLGAFPVTEVKRRERRKNPSAPFTTSTIQQEAAKRLGFGSKRTMRVAQSLYEGVDIGDEGAVGLITYMRTDSTRIAESAAEQARDYLRGLFGAEYLAERPQLYVDGKKGQKTQDAHEAIRPTDPARRPEHIKRHLNADQFKLYQLIWQRFMASQMAPAVFDTTTIDFDVATADGARRYLFRATGSVVKFQGFLALYRDTREEGEGKALEDEQALPVAEKGEAIPVRSIEPAQHFTEPPPRFSEASLVKELERLGIGRPSTYAQIISVLVDRHYTQLEQRRFTPTKLGETVERVMVKQFPDIFNVGFTSTMETELDKVEEGELHWQQVLGDFYTPFEASLERVDLEMLVGEAFDLSELDKERCPECGSRLVAKAGFFGPYVACERHPKECRFTRKLGVDRKPAIPTDEKCHECGEMMVIRHSRSGQFLGCSTFPKCRGTRPMPTGVKCPKDGGDIAERRSKKRGKKFYGCSNYPKCDFVLWDKPVPETCPECGYVGAEAKRNKTRGEYRKCVSCGNEWEVESGGSEEAGAA